MEILKNKKVASVTLGCKVNLYDTEAMVQILAGCGCEIVEFSEKADIYIINTCTVTNFGDKKSRQMLRRAKKMNEDAVIVACGCYTQVEPEKVKEIGGVSIILGTKDRMRIAEFIAQYYEGKNQRDFVSDIMDQREFEDLQVSEMGGRTRAYLKIQEGCDRFCSYCIIPYARGPVRSRLPQSILDEANRLAQKGYKEIVLAGIHVASYGKDMKSTSLLEILSAVHEIQGIRRIRFSSVEPLIITDEFIETVTRLEKICHHFHLSLQSGCAETLQRMNRRYSPEDYAKAVDKLRAAMPDVGITTDIIVGFPGETEEDFLQSCEFVRRMKLSRVHVFPYSPKIGTKAALMDNQIPDEVKSLRAKAMGEIADSLENEFVESFMNKEMSVLFERDLGNNIYEGHSSSYITVRCESNENLDNTIRNVRITRVQEGIAYGELIF